MSKRTMNLLRGTGIGLLAAASLASGCASGSGATSQAQEVRVAALQTRVEESERINGRLTARVEELEDQVFLLQDRVDANRIALQRRGVMRRVGEGVAQAAPRPSPQSYYESQGYREQRDESFRDIRRIPLTNSQTPGDSWGKPGVERDDIRDEARQDQRARNDPAQPSKPNEAEVVIGEREYREFTGESLGKQESRTTTRARTAQPGVTEEKLPTTGELRDKSASDLEKPESAERKAEQRDSLTIYKDSLALYRSGSYAAALKGFREFMDSKPRADYVDNALYWLGECEYGLGDYAKSVGYFERVLREQPDGNKVPDALLKMSFALEKMGRNDDAQETLRTLTSQYPSTNAAKLGQQKLQGGS